MSLTEYLALDPGIFNMGYVDLTRPEIGVEKYRWAAIKQIDGTFGVYYHFDFMSVDTIYNQGDLLTDLNMVSKLTEIGSSLIEKYYKHDENNKRVVIGATGRIPRKIPKESSGPMGGNADTER